MQQQPLPNQRPRHPVPALDPEDIRVLQRCRSEALNRSIPISLGLSGLAYVLMKNGVLNKSLNYGYMPKMVVASIIGYGIGKASFIPRCKEMIMQNDTPFGRYLRSAQNRGQFQQVYGPMVTSPQEEQSSDYAPEDRIENEALYEYNKLADSLSEYTKAADEATKPPNYNSYSDLRSANRNEQNSKHKSVFRPPPILDVPMGDTSQEDVEVQSPAISYPSSSSDNRRNKYGDSWE